MLKDRYTLQRFHRRQMGQLPAMLHQLFQATTVSPGATVRVQGGRRNLYRTPRVLQPQVYWW